MAGYRLSARTNTHTPTAQPGMAGCSQDPSPRAHTHTAHPGQEWRGTGGGQTQALTPQPNSQEWRVEAETPTHTHPHPHHTPLPQIAASSGHPCPSTSTIDQGEEWRGSGGGAHKHTRPNMSARIGGVKGEKRKDTHEPRTLSRSSGVQVEHTHYHTHPNNQARNGGVSPKPKHTHTHPHHTPLPQMAGSSEHPYPSTRTTHPGQEWRGTGRACAQTHTAQHPSQDCRGAGTTQAQTHHKNRQPGLAGWGQNPYPNTHTLDPSQDWRGYRETRTQTKAPHNSRKPGVHSPDTGAACAMQVTQPNVTRSPGVRLRPKADPALGLKAGRAAPKHLGTQVPRPRRLHALGTGYARKSDELLGFCPKEGTCASTGAHPPGVTRSTRLRQLALRMLPGAALFGATSQVWQDVSRLPSSSTSQGQRHPRNLFCPGGAARKN